MRVPAVMSVLLFLVGILIWFVVRPRRGSPQRVHENVIREGLRRYRVPALVTLVAALVATVVSLVVADADPPSVLALAAVMILVGAAAVALGRLFTVVFGAVNGTFVALGALMIQIFAFGGRLPDRADARPAAVVARTDAADVGAQRNADGPRRLLRAAVLDGGRRPRRADPRRRGVHHLVATSPGTGRGRRSPMDEPTVVMERVG